MSTPSARASYKGLFLYSESLFSKMKARIQNNKKIVHNNLLWSCINLYFGSPIEKASNYSIAHKLHQM